MNIHIHGKRTETIYPFTVEHKGTMIQGRHITVYEHGDIPQVRTEIKWDNARLGSQGIRDAIDEAIEDYEKIHN